MIARAPRAERDAAMLGRGARFLTNEFVIREIVPRVPGVTAATTWSVDIARVTPSRLTVRYSFDNRVIVYGKAYRGDLAPAKFRRVFPARAFQTIRRLWENGFGPAGYDHVPEPVAYLEEENMILMGAAAGAPLDRLLPRQTVHQATQSARAAARWLVELHAMDTAALPIEPACERIRILKELDAVSKAAAEAVAAAPAASPEDSRTLLEFLSQVQELAPPSKLPVRLTPIHSQYTTGTVFVDGSHVTAIDLDNVSVSDPAIDVARFVSKVKWSALCDGAESAAGAEQVAAAFLHEYCTASAASLPTLPYYMALYGLKEYAKRTLKTDPGSAERQLAEEFCRSEIGACCRSVSRRIRSTCRNGSANHFSQVTQPEFLAQSIGPLAGSGAGECRVTTVRDLGNGRLTLRYDLPAGVILYGKVYDNLRGRRLQLLQTLWREGFHGGSPHQVPEVLAVFPDHNLLVMAEAPGVALSDMLRTADDSALIAGTREAARWLAALHGSSVRIGAPEADSDSLRLFRLAERLVQSCARFPRQLNSLLDLLYWLRHQLEKLPEGRPTVQTHGSYNPSHIFIAPGVITAIDLDRSRVSDPAKDVAEFLSALCSAAFGLGWSHDRLNRLTAAFLEEYLSRAPAPPGLSYYRSAYTLLHVCGDLREAGPDESAAIELVKYHMRALEPAPLGS